MMAVATDVQMQAYADQRIRVAAEQWRALDNAFRDHKTSIEDIFTRANGGPAWVDAREDGPPKLLANQDFLVFNTIISRFADLLRGVETGTETEITNQRAAIVSDIRANLTVFLSACMSPPPV